MPLSRIRSIGNERRRYVTGGRGFTLAEMAIVVMLVGILLTLGVGTLTSRMENAAISTTKQKQEAIKVALSNYLRTNWRLPCPDRTFPNPAVPNGSGDDNRATPGNPATACTGAAGGGVYGILPYADLGLSREMALDGWGNFFSYHVTVTPNWTLTANFNPANSGVITVNDRNPGVTAVTTTAVAVVVSHGANGTGSYTVRGNRNTVPTAAFADELENTNGNITYFARDRNDNTAAAGGAFDDIVMVLRADDLLEPLRADGTLKAQQDQLDAAKNVIITSAFATCTLPAAAPAAFASYTAFGSTLAYTRNSAAAMSISTTPGSTTMFTVTKGAVAFPVLFSSISPILAAYARCP